MILRNFIKKVLIFGFISFLVFLSDYTKLSAEEINWVEVAKINNEIQMIDANSVKYNNKGFLSVITKHSDLDQNDQDNKNTKSYLLVVDCEKRLFSKLPANGEANQVKVWNAPTEDKLLKKTILNSCSY